MKRHQSQTTPLTRTVVAMMTMAEVESCTTEWSGPMSFWMPSMATWAKEVIWTLRVSTCYFIAHEERSVSGPAKRTARLL